MREPTAVGDPGTPRRESLDLFHKDLAVFYLAAIVNSCHDAVIGKNADDIIETWNTGAERLYGYKKSEAVGQHISIVVPPELRQELSMILDRTKRGEEVDRFETTRQRKDGVLVEVSLTVSPIRDAAGQIVGASTIAHDITEHKRSERALRDNRERLRELSVRLMSSEEEARRHLAQEIHDDLSQRLSALLMDVSVLEQRIPSSLLEVCRKAHRIVETTGELARDVQQLSRRLHPAVLEKLGLVAALKAECKGFSEQVGVPVEFVTRNVPGRLPLDHSLSLFRVAQESLHNAAKHSRAQSVKVALAAEGDDLVLRIEDSGVGFNPATAMSGRGLGLLSMEERVRALQGGFSIGSQPGMGTVVEARVPLSGRAA